MLESINPANLETIARYEEHSNEEFKMILRQADAAQRSWAETDFETRETLMKNAASVLLNNKEEYARLMTLEMGKPLKQSYAEIEKCAWVCDYYAENASRFLADEAVETHASESYIAYRPLGVVLAVMPWNFPFWQVFRFAAPALMAGNGALLKHASNVTGCALAIEKVFKLAGFPENLFRTLKIKSTQVASVIDDPAIQAVTLTGSVGAGRSVAAKAGEALKKTVLELGGSDSYLILEDAELDSAIQACVTSRMINGGQSCIAAKRFIVVEKIYNVFLEKFTEVMHQKEMGDPMDALTDLGPQARVKLRDELHEQVMKSISLGAKCTLGGNIPDKKGAWYPATVLTEVVPGMPAYDEEMFGPVAAVIKAGNDEEAVRIANDSVFGLGAAVFTSDKKRGKYIARNLIEAGCCFVNEFVQSDPRLPFGGIKQSGYGRELSRAGILEFVNIKSVFIK